MPRVGIVPHMPIERYRQEPGLSKSKLDLLHESPEIFNDFQLGRYAPEQTPAMQTGSFVHAIILENRRDFVVQPSELEDENGVRIKWDGRKTICKLWSETQVLPVLTQLESDKVEALAQSCISDPLAAGLLKRGQAELSLFSRDETGRLFKARPDWAGEDYFVDIKTTTNATAEEFSKEIYKRRYHVQAALYLRVAGWLGMPQTKFYFVAIQKSNPPRINVRQLHESALDLGGCELDDDLELLHECEASGNWYGYSGKSGAIEKVDVPDWAHQRYAARDLQITSGGKPVKF